jgi:hypothetical protein
MTHLKYECKVNYVRLPLISIYRCLKLIFENAISDSNTCCWALCIARRVRPSKNELCNCWTYQATSHLPALPVPIRKGD